MKKLSIALILSLLLSMLVIPAMAVEADMTYSFELSVNGKDTVEVSTGDIITLTLKLRRTDAAQAYSMHGMQAELRYDSSFLQLVDGSATTYTGVDTNDIALVDGFREFYMNFLSMSGGTKWEAETLIGTVQFKVIGTSGVTKITNEDFLVSLPDGSGSYQCVSNELLIILSTDCTVKFQSNGGTEVESQTIQFGEKITKPAEPQREGYKFAGWYIDIHLSQEWSFDSTVEGNMTLYAKWEKDDGSEHEPTTPVAPGENKGDGVPCWLWWILILLILLLAVTLWMKYKHSKKKRRR